MAFSSASCAKVTVFFCVTMLIVTTLRVDVCNAQAVVPALYMFGASYVDVGNNNYLPLSLAKANYPHNGVDYPGEKSTGRFSNGENIADFVAKKIGLPTSPPYLSLINGATPPITGISFASGGAGILNETGQKNSEKSKKAENAPETTIVIDALKNSLVGSHEILLSELKFFNSRAASFSVQYIPLARQVDYFSLVHDNLVQQLGPSAAKMHLLKSIFAIFIGSNDLQDYFSPNSSISNVYTPQQYIERMLSTYKGLLKTLYELGARKILVAGSSPVGCYPMHRTTSKTGECNVETNYWCSKYNDHLKIMLQQVKSESFGLSFAYFDLYGTMVMFRPDDNYGFTNIKEACCGLGNLNADAACIPTSNYCPNRKDHVFWDFIHPTEAVASIIADIIYDGTHEHMVPMNLKQLVDI